MGTSKLVGLHRRLLRPALLTMIGGYSLEGLPFPNEEFDFVCVVTCPFLQEVESDGITG